ncbi:MAG: hypothetical protein LBR32_10985 [Propionibacteriaceae bacterium]|nr:hypothetical protein [Propionibacteriaceae bacterium]
MANAYLNTYIPALDVPTAWTGSVSTCAPGAPSSAAQEATFTALNFVRAMAKLPAVTEDLAESAKTQQAALMMEARNELSHYRSSWTQCATADGISTGPGAEIIAMNSAAVGAPSIAQYIQDSGSNNRQLGHRATVLGAYTKAGSGSTTSYNAMHFFSWSTAGLPDNWSWPSAGYFPYNLMEETGYDSYYETGPDWSFYVKTGSLSSATVSVAHDGSPVSVSDVRTVTGGGLAWVMPIDLPQPEVGDIDTYTVTVSGITGGSQSAVSYDVDVFALPTVTAGSGYITGTRNVGQTLTLTPNSWSPSDLTYDYQWYRVVDGVYTPIATGETYKLQPADEGAKIGFLIKGKKVGYVPASFGPVNYTWTVGARLSVSGSVAISSSSPQMGVELTANLSSWSPSGVAYAYQWYADSAAIAGATSDTYTPTAADVGKAITVSVTGSHPDYVSKTVTSAATAAVAKADFAKGAPTVSGSAVVGQTLTGDPGSWTPSDGAWSYQWLRNGVAISGATGASYTLVAADQGAAISFQATQAKDGYNDATATSAPTAAVAAAPGSESSSGTSPSGPISSGTSTSSTASSGTSTSGTATTSAYSSATSSPSAIGTATGAVSAIATAATTAGGGASGSASGTATGAATGATSGTGTTTTGTAAPLADAIRMPVSSPIYLKQKSSYQLLATAQLGSAASKAKIAYTSSKPKVLKVSATGKLTAKAVKKRTKVVVTLTADQVVKKLTVYVVPKTGKVKASVKAPKTLKAKGVYWLTAKTGQGTNAKVTFKSSKKSVLTVDKYGKVTAKKKGKAVVTIKIGTKKIKKTITVK